MSICNFSPIIDILSNMKLPGRVFTHRLDLMISKIFSCLVNSVIIYELTKFSLSCGSQIFHHKMSVLSVAVNAL